MVRVSKARRNAAAVASSSALPTRTVDWCSVPPAAVKISVRSANGITYTRPSRRSRPTAGTAPVRRRRRTRPGNTPGPRRSWSARRRPKFSPGRRRPRTPFPSTPTATPRSIASRQIASFSAPETGPVRPAGGDHPGQRIDRVPVRFDRFPAVVGTAVPQQPGGLAFPPGGHVGQPRRPGDGDGPAGQLQRVVGPAGGGVIPRQPAVPVGLGPDVPGLDRQFHRPGVGRATLSGERFPRRRTGPRRHLGSPRGVECVAQFRPQRPGRGGR